MFEVHSGPLPVGNSSAPVWILYRVGDGGFDLVAWFVDKADAKFASIAFEAKEASDNPADYIDVGDWIKEITPDHTEAGDPCSEAQIRKAAIESCDRTNIFIPRHGQQGVEFVDAGCRMIVKMDRETVNEASREQGGTHWGVGFEFFGKSGAELKVVKIDGNDIWCVHTGMHRAKPPIQPHGYVSMPLLHQQKCMACGAVWQAEQTVSNYCPRCGQSCCKLPEPRSGAQMGPEVIKANDDELQRRVYYQNIVYAVSKELERAFAMRPFARGEVVVCGTLGSPSTQVQELMKELVDRDLARGRRLSELEPEPGFMPAPKKEE